MIFDIPGYARLDIRHLVCDYNGTLATDGRPDPEALIRMRVLADKVTLHVITADTFGTVAEALAGLPVTLHILSSDDHTREKAAYVRRLGAAHCAALGNGHNDIAMLQEAALGIAILGEEGCARPTLEVADLICPSPIAALGLFENPRRLIATLRR